MSRIRTIKPDFFRMMSGRIIATHPRLLFSHQDRLADCQGRKRKTAVQNESAPNSILDDEHTDAMLQSPA